MFNSNYYQMLKTVLMQSSTYSVSTTAASSRSLSLSTLNNSFKNANNFNIEFGDTEVKSGAANFFNHSISLSEVSRSASDVPTSAGDTIRTVTKVVKNNGSSSVTVGAIGCSLYMSGDYYSFMFTTEILDTPITIEPGESYAFTIQF